MDKAFDKSSRKTAQNALMFSSTNPAMVMSIDPLLIAAYSSDIDAVAMLQYPQQMLEIYNLEKYDKLITVNGYLTAVIHKDLFPGPESSRTWKDFFPTIVDFLTSDYIQLRKHKQNIPEVLWNYVKCLGEDYLKNGGGKCRKEWFN